ncbi:unnamed protein product, partial [Symbiodinium pilosum]
DAKLFMLMVQAEHGALFRLRHGSGGWSRQCDLGTGRSAIDSFWRPMISRGCLRASGNRNYWGISDNATLKPVLDKAVNPSHPPDVSSFSNYVYEDIPTFGLFISPGLDEELSVGRCRPEKPDASSGRVRRCHALETHNMSLAACRLRALRIGADTVMVDGEACELLKCLNAASALQYAQSKEVMVIETGVYSKHCSDILYATMPMNLTYQGVAGLAESVSTETEHNSRLAKISTLEIQIPLVFLDLGVFDPSLAIKFPTPRADAPIGLPELTDRVVVSHVVACTVLVVWNHSLRFMDV